MKFVWISLLCKDYNAKFQFYNYENLFPFNETDEILFYKFNKNLKNTQIPKINDIKTLEDINKYYNSEDLNINNLFIFKIKEKDNYIQFYKEYNKTFIWCLDKHNGYILEKKSNFYVAKSLGEFLWRISLEYIIYLKNKEEEGFSLEEQDYINDLVPFMSYV